MFEEGDLSSADCSLGNQLQYVRLILCNYIEGWKVSMQTECFSATDIGFGSSHLLLRWTLLKR
jgi:hypothetical protein